MDRFHAQYLFALHPFGCRQCAVPRTMHGCRWTKSIGTHYWMQPTERQIKNRMKIRRKHMGAYRWLR